MRKKHKVSIADSVVYGVLLLTAFLVLFPIYILILNAIKADVEIKASPISLPSAVRIENFRNAFVIGDFGIGLLNSLKIALLVCAAVILLSSLAAYALARLAVPGKLKINMYLLMGLAVPPQLFLIPLYNNLSILGLNDRHAGLILVYIGTYLPFSIFFLRSFYLSLPREVEECAKIDGCSTLQIMIKMIIPMSRPAILSLIVILFTWVWNEFTFAVTLIQSNHLKTAATQYLAFASNRDIDLSMVAAAGIITSIPVVALFIGLQKSFIEGMTSGSVKG